MPVDPRRIEVVDEITAAILREKSGAERLDMGHRMWRTMRDDLMHFLKTRHPEWTENQVRVEAAKRISGGAI